MDFGFISISILAFVFAGWQFVMRRRLETILRTTKESLFLRERKIQTILQNAPIVFSAVDVNGIFQISEGKGLEKLGRKSNQSVGLSIFEMHNQNPIILDAVRRSLAGEQVATSFVLNGISYDLFMGPEKNTAGIVTGVSMLSVDITDRKRAEEEKSQLAIREQTATATSKLKSDFLATMSHEIRTPINGVLGMTGLLLDTDLTTEQREYTEAIKQSGAGLLTVINDILDFSKIEAGKLDFEVINFELPELVVHSMKSLKFLAAQKGVDLRIDLDPSLRVWVKGDPGRFRQILNNLVGNAIKFTEKGRVSVRVRPTFNSFVRIEVEDTGIGIAQDIIKKMFVAFSQAEASMARRFGGTGLGLSISKHLVQKMGGEIGVTSEIGVGSTFWFEIPFEDGQMPSQESLSNPVALPRVFVGDAAARILLAEDNKTNQIITATMLKKMGCNANIVTNGYDALAALEESDYDLVLMDCQMPKMDGFEATRRFRSGKGTRNRGIPIVAMTASAMTGDREKCLGAGMDDYITKPITYESLASAVSVWLHRQRKHAA